MFRFRLQRVLELREESEQEKARELAAAEAAVDKARRTRDELLRMQEESRAELLVTQSGLPRIGHLQQLDIVLVALEQRILLANDALAGAEQRVAEARLALEVAARDRQVLDRLKEKHAQAWRMEEQHAERQNMDEIALSRFGRARDAASVRTTSTGNSSTPAPHVSTPDVPMEGNP